MTSVRALNFRKKIPVGILGATGVVGQQLVAMLAEHPWFRIEALAASKESEGKIYQDAVNWILSSPIPEEAKNLLLQKCDSKINCNLVFSALDEESAGDIESAFAQNGYAVISNTKAHRNDPDVPLIVPEVNSQHLVLLDRQKKQKSGFIATNPNCSVIGLTMALKPIHELFSLEAVEVMTMQAISGSGHPGTPSIDIIDNIIPYIKDEEEKIESEPLKILGQCFSENIENASFKVSAQANRVPITDGHMACVSIRCREHPELEQIISAWSEFSGEAQMLELPSAPAQPIQYFMDPRYPQPKLHRGLNKGMTVSVGRLRKCPVLDYKFVILLHNAIRGAAGGSILNAELLVKHGYIFW